LGVERIEEGWLGRKMWFYGNVLAGEPTEKCGVHEKDNKKRPISSVLSARRPAPAPTHTYNDDAAMNMIVLIITL